MFVWLESQIEGNSNKRKLLDKAPWSASKLSKRTLKHSLWGLAALITGCGFISYFIPARELYLDIFTGNAGFWTTCWVWFFAICTYLNAGWMREQMCLHCCPYARFQAVMFDANTKTVTYDATRGEARGPVNASNKPNSVIVLTVTYVLRSARRGLIFAKAFNTSALTAAPVSMPVMKPCKNSTTNKT